MAQRLKGVLFLSILLWGSVALCTVSTAQDAALQEQLHAETLYPGDLIELKLTLASATPVRWSLNPPSHPHLRLLSVQQLPVQASAAGGYKTRWILAFQAIRPGAGVLQDGFVEPAGGGEEQRLAVSSRELQVDAFADLNDSSELEPLTTRVVSEQSINGLVFLLAGLFLVALVAVLLWWRNRRVEKGDVAPRDGRDLLRQDLAAILSGDAISRAKAQYLLEEYESILSKDAVLQLERLAYARTGDVVAAKAALEEEVAG